MQEIDNQVQEYMTDDEEVSYVLSYRPVGLVNWIKSLFGMGVTHWYLTDQRLIQHTNVAGGFSFQDVALDGISSIEYGSKLNIPLVAVGTLLALLGLVSIVESVAGVVLLAIGALLVGYAFYRRRQVLAVHASGGVTLALGISKGEKIDNFLWYVNAERQKQS